MTGAIDPDLYERRQALLETQRGCPNRCAYCTYHKGLPSVCYFSLARVQAELDCLILEREVQAIRICDSVFPSDLDRAKEIVRHLLRLKGRPGVRLPWIYWEFTIDSVDEEFLALVSALRYRAPIRNVDAIAPADRPQLYDEMLRDYVAVNCVGIQSLHGPALVAIGRRAVGLGGLKSFLDSARRHNIVLKLDLILGLPLETLRSWKAGLAQLLPFLNGTDHILNLHRLQILPGSDLEEAAARFGLRCLHGNWGLVTATSTISEAEMARASKEAAMLFRVMNSPLRSAFFAASHGAGGGCVELAARLLDMALADASLAGTRLASDVWLEDPYWNRDVYLDVPSPWLAFAMSHT